MEAEVAYDHELDTLASGWAERQERLADRYGHWGLALFEAVLAAADAAASSGRSLATEE